MRQPLYGKSQFSRGMDKQVLNKKRTYKIQVFKRVFHNNQGIRIKIISKAQLMQYFVVNELGFLTIPFHGKIGRYSYQKESVES